jgi:hypothetical protein
LQIVSSQKEEAQATSKKEAQGRPGARCTRGLVCKMHIENAHEHTGSAEAVRPSLRNGFTAYFVLSPVTGLVDTVIPERREPLENLTPATGRQDHATSPSASASFVRAHKTRDDALASTASRTNLRDDHDTPLLGVRDDIRSAADSPDKKSEKFFRRAVA